VANHHRQQPVVGLRELEMEMVRKQFSRALEVAGLLAGIKGFKGLPHRWVVMRT